MLEREHVRYVVIGGVAVVLRGYVRPIVDLDFVVDDTPEEMNRAMDVLYALGFVPSIPLPMSMLTMMRLFDSSQREINVFARPYVPFAELWKASEKICIGESVVRVASIEHVIRAKRIEGRQRDLLDINGLLTLETDNHAQSRALTTADGEQDDPNGH